MLKLNHWYDILGGGMFHATCINNKYLLRYTLGTEYKELKVSKHAVDKYGICSHIACLRAMHKKRGKNYSIEDTFYTVVTYIRNNDRYAV